jgi:hypothetical protein
MAGQFQCQLAISKEVRWWLLETHSMLPKLTFCPCQKSWTRCRSLLKRETMAVPDIFVAQEQQQHHESELGAHFYQLQSVSKAPRPAAYQSSKWQLQQRRYQQS